MADSIAKLAVVITGDTGPLNASLRTGAANVTNFQRRVESGSGSLRGFIAANRQTGFIAGNMLRISGATSGLNGGFMNLAKSGGGLGLVIAALGAVMYKSAEASNSLAAKNKEVADSYEAAFKAASGQDRNIGFDGAELNRSLSMAEANLKSIRANSTVTPKLEMSEWQRASDTWVNQVGQTFGDLGRKIAKDLEWLPGLFNSIFRSEGADKAAADLARMAEATKKLTEQTKAQEEAQNKASAAFTHKMDQLKRRAESLSESLRTPAEVFADTVAEIQELGGMGLIDPDKVTRGIQNAKEELLAAGKAIKQTQDTYRPVAAAERYSQAAASAVNEGKAAQQQQLEIEKQQLKEAQTHRKILQDGFKALADKKSLTLIKGNL